MGLPLPAEEKLRRHQEAREKASARRTVTVASNGKSRVVVVDVCAKGRGLLFQPTSVANIGYQLVKNLVKVENSTIIWCFDSSREMPRARSRLYKKRYIASDAVLKKNEEKIRSGEMKIIQGRLFKTSQLPLDDAFLQETGFDQNTTLDKDMWSRFLSSPALKERFWYMVAEAIVQASCELGRHHTFLIDPPTPRYGSRLLRGVIKESGITLTRENKPTFYGEADQKVCHYVATECRKNHSTDFDVHTIDYDMLPQLLLCIPSETDQEILLHLGKGEVVNIMDYRRCHGRAWHSFLLLSCGSDYSPSWAKFGCKPLLKNQWDMLSYSGDGPVHLHDNGNLIVNPVELMGFLNEIQNKRSRRGKPTGDEFHSALIDALWTMIYWLQTGNLRPDDGSLVEPESDTLHGLRLFSADLTLEQALSGDYSEHQDIVIATSPFASD